MKIQALKLALLSGFVSSICLAEEFKSGPFTFGVFVDSYAAHDFNDPKVNDRPYTTQVLHEDQIDLNLAVIESKLSTDDIRGRFALQHGTSVESNYAAEEHLFWRYIQEATLGTKITDKLWIDGGIYLAHVGFENFNSKENWNYTRSLVAEFSPYYETGIKLSYQFDDKTTGQFHVLRGWQNISSNADPFIGLQLSHALSEKTQLTYANLIGELNGQRIFHDFIVKTDLSEDFSAALQFDVGSQELEDQNSETAWWHGFSLMTQYRVNEKLAIGSRIERFYDPHQVVLTTVNGPSFNTTGLSANIDYKITKNLLWRNEYKAYIARNPVFPEEDDFSNDDQIVVTSLSLTF